MNILKLEGTKIKFTRHVYPLSLSLSFSRFRSLLRLISSFHKYTFFCKFSVLTPNYYALLYDINMIHPCHMYSVLHYLLRVHHLVAVQCTMNILLSVSEFLYMLIPFAGLHCYLFAGKWMRNTYFRIFENNKIVISSETIFRLKLLPCSRYIR